MDVCDEVVVTHDMECDDVPGDDEIVAQDTTDKSFFDGSIKPTIVIDGGDAPLKIDDDRADEPLKKKSKAQDMTNARMTVLEFIESGGFSPKDAKLMKNITKGKTPGFFFKTSDVAALCNMMYALRDLINDVRFVVSKSGIKVGETACADNMFLFAKFMAKHFTFFECTPPAKRSVANDEEEDSNPDSIIIAFDPRELYKILRNNQQRDTMIWIYNDTKRNSAGCGMLSVIKYPHEDGSMESRYDMNLLDLKANSYEAPKEVINYMLVFDPTTLNATINGLNSLGAEFDDWVTISCNKDQIQFVMEQGDRVDRARYCFKTKLQDCPSSKPRRNRNKTNSTYTSDEVNISNDEPDIVRKYRLKYLHQLVKCFSITDDGIIMYVFKEYPLIFEVKIGDIGHLRCALLYKSEDDDDDE